MACIYIYQNFIGALQYPLLFPLSANGWHVNLKLYDGKELTALVAILARKYYTIESKRTALNTN